MGGRLRVKVEDLSHLCFSFGYRLNHPQVIDVIVIIDISPTHVRKLALEGGGGVRVSYAACSVVSA